MPVHLSLHDTLTELILSAIPSAFGTFLMRQCYLCVPSGLEEAVIIDGTIQRQVTGRSASRRAPRGWW